MPNECYVCGVNEMSDPPKSETVVVGQHWRAAHAFGTGLPGWLVVVPRRHVVALSELTLDEAAELGPLLVRLTAALREVVGCEKTYVALFAEAEGFAHVHFHVVPRMADLDPSLRGPKVFQLLGVSDDETLDTGSVDALCDRLAEAVGV